MGLPAMPASKPAHGATRIDSIRARGYLSKGGLAARRSLRGARAPVDVVVAASGCVVARAVVFGG